MKQIKSKHLAKADFIRELKSLTTQLNAIGDSSSKDSRWTVLSSKLDSFIAAALLLRDRKSASFGKSFSLEMLI